MNERDDWRFRPAEGWSVVVLVALLGLILATAIDEPAWVNGRGALTDCLATCALLGALVGFVGPKVGWGRWTTHVIGAVFAGLLVSIIAGWAVLPPGASVSQAFHATAYGSVEAYLDLAWRGRQFTTQEVHYVLVLGALVWGTMQFGSYAVFGHRRPLSAVVVVGLVLLANMALTRRDQLVWLVLYAAVSLFLLIQMHAFGERTTWTPAADRRPGIDVAAVPARRHRVHRGRHGGLAAAHPAGRIEPARRGVDRVQRAAGPDRQAARAAVPRGRGPARRRRRGVRVERPDRRPVVQRRRRRVHRDRSRPRPRACRGAPRPTTSSSSTGWAVRQPDQARTSRPATRCSTARPRCPRPTSRTRSR